MDVQKSIKIGTRGSPLALAQAHETKDRLLAAHGTEAGGALSEDNIEIEIFTTAGDRIQDKSLRTFGGKGLFTKEIEDALLEGRIDLAVHSMKDVQTVLPEGLHIAAILPREDVRDAFISPKAGRIDDLPEGAVVGTASLRRQAQVKWFRPDLEVVTFRGSVQTRLEKLRKGEVDATFLAVAGLNRLGLSSEVTSFVEPDVMLPAVAQGAIGIECREGDDLIEALLAPLNSEATRICVDAERAFLRRLDGSCRTPIAALAQLDEDRLYLQGQVLAPDGGQEYSGEASRPMAENIDLGIEVAERLIKEAGEEFLAALVE
jgi:hydroxymethylbilane synthase